LRLFSFGGYGLALAALALVVFGAYDSYPILPTYRNKRQQSQAIFSFSINSNRGKLETRKKMFWAQREIES